MQVHGALEGLASRLQAQMQLLQRIETATPAAAAAGAAGIAGTAVDEAGQSTLASRRELLEQALEKLQALKVENGQLWRMLEDHLAGSSGSGSDGGGSRPNHYAAFLEGERDRLERQLAAAQRENGEVAARLAAAQAAISKLQAVVQRLSAAGSGARAAGGGTEAETVLSLPAPSVHAASPAAMPVPQHSRLSSASDAEVWQAEKRLLKAICKLALAVTMDQVGGRQEAASLAHELAPLMAAHSTALRQLGLHKVWASLNKLALAGGTGGSASRASQQPPPQHQHSAAAPPPPPLPSMGAAAAVADELPSDVWALQQRVRQYKASRVHMSWCQQF